MADRDSISLEVKKQVVAGTRYGCWTVVGETFLQKRAIHVLCRCICGTTRIVSLSNLRMGKSTSCGCFRRKELSKRRKHGESKTPLYRVWNHMMGHCYRSKTKGFHNYGGRGIAVCTEWHDFPVFQAWALSHGYEEHLTLDRILVNGNYEPSNCRFIPRAEQHRNKRTNRFLTAFGETKCLAEWIRDSRCAVKSELVIKERMARGATPEQAIATKGILR